MTTHQNREPLNAETPDEMAVRVIACMNGETPVDPEGDAAHWRARAEKAEQERARALDSLEQWKEASISAMAGLERAEESHGFTVDDLDESHLLRALQARGRHFGDLPRLRISDYPEDVVQSTEAGLRAALTPPPATPDWQSESAERIRGAVWGVELPNEAGATGTFLAARLARHGYKVVPLTEQDEAELEGGQR